MMKLPRGVALSVLGKPVEHTIVRINCPDLNTYVRWDAMETTTEYGDDAKREDTHRKRSREMMKKKR